MIRTHRVHRYDRKAWRREWYLGPAARLALIAPLAALVAWNGGGSLMLVVLLSLAGGIGSWRGWRESRLEREGWERMRSLTLQFEDGVLVLRDGIAAIDSRPLATVAAIDAIGSRRRIERIVVDDRDGSRTVFAGLQDMEAFSADLRGHAPAARYRRMTMGFPMRLKEMTA